MVFYDPWFSNVHSFISTYLFSVFHTLMGFYPFKIIVIIINIIIIM